MAAIALDRRVNGLQSSLDPVRELASRLQEAFPENSAARANLLEPTAADLFERAFTNVAPAESVQTVSDLTAKAIQIVAELAEASKEGSEESIESLRDFCLALAQSAQVQSSAVRIVSSHPHRR
jgi:geranylgeranyl pyrophosphate synthase